MMKASNDDDDELFFGGNCEMLMKILLLSHDFVSFLLFLLFA